MCRKKSAAIKTNLIKYNFKALQCKVYLIDSVASFKGRFQCKRKTICCL